MMTLAPTVPTLEDLKARMAALYDQLKIAERVVNNDIDPDWLAASHAVTVALDATQEALTQADMARIGGDVPRARRRLSVAWDKLQEAGNALAEYEVMHGG
jgi:hypothetical protein